MAKLLLLLTFLCLNSRMAASADSMLGARTHWDFPCRFRFTLPDEWEEYIPENYVGPHACDVNLRPSDWKARIANSELGLSDYTIHLRVFDASLEEAARQAGFTRQDDTWVTSGRQGVPSYASTISGREWRGLIGSRTFARSNANGYYAGLGETLITVLHNGSKSAIIETDGGFWDEVINIANSFEFLTCKRK